jgi:Zn-finger nucleic acid-binding protein
MAKVRAGQANPPLRIDQCRRSHGLWFDRGELEDILRRGRLDEESRILRLLADMFGRKLDQTTGDSQS